MSAPPASLRPMLPADGPALCAIFRDAIEELAADDYDEAQREAWASAADDEAAFAARLAAMLTLVATREGEVVGFGSLKEGRVVEMLYVAPDVAGEGVGAALLDAIERLARARGAKALEASASDAALGFFTSRGYEPRSRSAANRAGQWLSTTVVTKTFPGAGPAEAER